MFGIFLYFKHKLYIHEFSQPLKQRKVAAGNSRQPLVCFIYLAFVTYQNL